VASTKKPKAKAGNNRAGKGDQTGKQAASKTAKPKKTRSKTAAKKSKLTTKNNSVKQRKIRVPDAAGQDGAGATRVQELDPFEVAKQTVKGSVPAIVEAMVEFAKQGSCTHAKTLLEMTGAKHMFDGGGEIEDSGAPWARLVLERLDEADSKAGREAESLEEAVER
jgi:hypothetical protein